jgi:hypothetical protein
MRSLPVLVVLLLSATLAACGGDDFDCDPSWCDPDAAIVADSSFAGTWQAQRTLTGGLCAFDFDPRLDVRLLIEGNSAVGYTAVDAFNVGTPGNPGTFNPVTNQLQVGFQEYWPGFGSQPDVAPGVSFTLRHDLGGLVGTSRANAFYSVDGELEQCIFDFTLTATRVSPGS